MLTKPKGECSNELESVVKMVHKSSKKIVDSEKEKGSSSSRNTFKSYYKKIYESGLPQRPLINSVVLNFNEVGMDHFYTFHQEHHPEKKLSTMDKFDDFGYESIIRCLAGKSRRRRRTNK